MSTPPLRRKRRWRLTAASADPSQPEGAPAKLRGPIANSRHVSARPRRQQASSALFRAALAVALLATLALAIPFVINAVRQPDAGASSAVPVIGNGSQPAVPGLEDGACMSFAPTQGRLGKTVFIDAGHGGLDPGVVGTATSGRTVQEKDATLAVATRLTGMLAADGYAVVMARTQDTPVIKLAASDSNSGAITPGGVRRDLVARAACANASAADVLVSIHFDGSSDSTVGGTETFYDAARPFAAANRKLATSLQAAMVARLGAPDRGVWTDDQLTVPTLTISGRTYGHLIVLGPPSPGWVDNPSQMPGALVEPLFVTNHSEARVAADPAGQDRIAQALEAGLQKFFSA
jgi:N-acetylmuramoyl-L-alanine amidase